MTESIVYASQEGLWEDPAAPLGEPEIALEEAIETRMAFLSEWLQSNVPASHDGLTSLDRVTREQVFWHHGYLVALRSVRNFIQSRRQALN